MLSISDFRIQEFGNIWDLIPHATNVTKLSGTCKFCEQSSIYTLKTSSDKTQLLYLAKFIYQYVENVIT